MSKKNNDNETQKNFEFEKLDKKSKSFMVAGIVFGIIGGVVLIISSIFQLLFDLNVIAVSESFSNIFDFSSLIIVVIMLVLSYVFYKLFKKNVVKNEDETK